MCRVQFAAVTAVVLWCEAAWVGWLTLRILRWTRGAPAAEMRHAVQVTDHLGPLLEHLAHYNPLPEKVHQIIRVRSFSLLLLLNCTYCESYVFFYTFVGTTRVANKHKSHLMLSGCRNLQTPAKSEVLPAIDNDKPCLLPSLGTLAITLLTSGVQHFLRPVLFGCNLL